MKCQMLLWDPTTQQIEHIVYIDETEIIHKDVHANTEILTLHHNICQHGNTNTNKTKST